MPQDVIMPQMGESIAEGTITAWLKKIGETVARDEPLFEMSTDKVDAEIPSPVEGVLLEIKVQPGETVAINTVVAVIGAAGDKAASDNGGAEAERSSAEPEVAAPASALSDSAAVSPTAGDGSRSNGGVSQVSVEQRRRTRSSPVVRKIAAEHSIDISLVTGTGISGRVTKSDILAFISGSAGGGRGAGVVAPATFTAPGVLEVPPAYRPTVFDGDRVEPMSKMRALIADHMVLSRRISPHVQTVWEVDFTRVAALRERHKDDWQQRHGAHLTFTSFITKATTDALGAFPSVNASIDDRRVIYHRDINIGIAVALDWGLIVPVIKQANELNLLGLTRHLGDLGERARNKKLAPEDLQHGTFTITNPGAFGGLFGLPVINQPQVAILGVGGIEKRPVVIDDMIAIRTRAYLSLSFDHRLVDGAVADQFMAKIKRGIEEFDASEL